MDVGVERLQDGQTGTLHVKYHVACPGETSSVEEIRSRTVRRSTNVGSKVPTVVGGRNSYVSCAVVEYTIYLNALGGPVSIHRAHVLLHIRQTKIEQGRAYTPRLTVDLAVVRATVEEDACSPITTTVNFVFVYFEVVAALGSDDAMVYIVIDHVVGDGEVVRVVVGIEPVVMIIVHLVVHPHATLWH